MASVSVLFGNEEKEISGLTRRTTCSKVLQALLTDRQSEIRSLLENGQSLSNEDIEIHNCSSVRELARSYVIVENWRGCEKPLSSKTQLLAVWQAWDNEQCHVTFSLRKDKSLRLRSNRRSRSSNVNKMEFQEQTDSSQFLHKISRDEKKRILRKMTRYQRARTQQSQNNIDGNNNAGKHFGEQDLNLSDFSAIFSGQKTNDKPMSRDTLSEEVIVDGDITGPNCFLEYDVNSKFSLSAVEGGFNRERCTYRRPHHRRRSLLMEDSDGVTDQNVSLTRAHKQEFHHYPYCRKSRRRSQSARRHRQRSRKHRDDRGSKRSCKPKSRDLAGSAESATSTVSPSLSSEVDAKSHSEGEDADDEKSVLAGFSSPLSRQKVDYVDSLLPFDDGCCNEASSTSTTTATDSSSGNTTFSETSNTSSGSITTSCSETSSSADFEAYFAKRDAAKAAVIASGKANSSEKSRSGAAKIFKPAQNLFSSLIKKKKTSYLNPANLPGDRLNSKPTGNSGVTAQEITYPVTLQASSSSNYSKVVKENSSSKSTSTFKSAKEKNQLLERESDRRQVDEAVQLVLVQQRTLTSGWEKASEVTESIGKVESQIDELKSNLADIRGVKSTSSSFENQQLQSPSPTSRWIQECDDKDVLEKYVSYCERIVDKQMKIEESKRNAELLLQELKNQSYWSVPDVNDVSKPNLSTAALGLVGEACGDSSDDESGFQQDVLSVSSGRAGKRVMPLAEDTKKSGVKRAALEVERTRTEMEANLYLGLRLSTELEEVDKLVYTSKQLLQSKGEALLTLIRELAQRDEGISPELWEEYGELLTAYDAEVSLQQYLAACAENDIAKRSQSKFESSTYSQHCRMDASEKPTSFASSELHQALSPWLWCEHCKQELEMSKKQLPSASPHWLTHGAVPPNFSNLPLPNQSVSSDKRSRFQEPTSLITPGMLPMHTLVGLSDFNESDYDEVSTQDVSSTAEIGATSTIISAEDAVPRGIVMHLPQRSIPQDSRFPQAVALNGIMSSSFLSNSTHADDSGNASAESTASFASTNSDCTDNGSRNSSCDGGSPRPSSMTTDNVDSAQSSPFSLRGTFKRNSSKSKFIFPPKQQKNEQDKKCGFASSTAGNVATESFPSGFVQTNDPKKLIRRNSGKAKRTAPAFQDGYARRATSFGKGAIRCPPAGILKKSIAHNSHCDLTRDANPIKEKQLTRLSSGRIASPLPSSHRHVSGENALKTGLCKSSNLSIFSDLRSKGIVKDCPGDNDSDTGLSSLHSTDSFDRLCPPVGETLV